MKSATNSLNHTEVLVLGSGLAGLMTSLKFAEKGFHVCLLAKADLAEGATRYAQGGIASVWSKTDSFEDHKRDTLTAGAGLCDESTVDLCVREGPARIQELIQLGVPFTKNSESNDPTETFDLHREGGHGKRRILHADDLTGWAIEKTLLDHISNNEKITVLRDHIAIDLIVEANRCVGAYVLNTQKNQILTLSSDLIVLATGGAGKVYLYTSNPDVSTGDGIAMAHRAGAKVANLEFMQFHPTCLYHPSARTFLISEALRGEGAVLKNLAMETFMDRHHPMSSLAPRDVVARAIDMEIKKRGDKHVLLDARSLGAQTLRSKFPHIYETCLFYGIDITKDPIPVVPAAHYTCGGVKTDHWAQSTLPGLYAVGEVACTGLHGANRLASNSLLEAVVFAHRCVDNGANYIRTLQAKGTHAATLAPHLPEWDSGQAVEIEEHIDIAANWLEIRHLMWNYVGIVRSNRRLERAKRRLELLREEINNYYWNYLLTKDLIELRNLLDVAELIVNSALLRKESRGLHYTVDYAAKDDNHFRHETLI